MHLILSLAVRIDARYIQLRGNVYQFHLRVPADLIDRYDKRFIRKSLATSKKVVVLREADKLARTYLAQFKAYRGNAFLTPPDVLSARLLLAEGYPDVDAFDFHHVEPKLRRHLARNGLDKGRLSILLWRASCPLWIWRLLRNKSDRV